MTTVVTLLIVGAVLLFLEVFLPGLIAGIIGAACLLAGIVMAYVHLGFSGGNLVLIFTLIALVIGAAAWVKFFPNSRVANAFVSKGTIRHTGVEKPELLGQTGTAYTDLRPSGTAIINGKRIDVVTEGGMVEKGNPVKVVAVEGYRVVVRAA